MENPKRRETTMPPVKKNPVKDKAVTDAVALYNQHKDMTITVESFEVAGEVRYCQTDEK